MWTVYFPTVTLAQCVTAWLDATGKKQKSVAAKAGLGAGKISEIATGKNVDPQWSTVEKIAAGFELPIHEFLAGPRPKGSDSAFTFGDTGIAIGLEDRLGNLLAHVKTLKGPARADFIRAVIALLTALERTNSAASDGTPPDDAR